mgnify:FL=1
MKIQDFYNSRQDEIILLFREFLESDMFRCYPVLKGKTSFVITGSIPSNHYDQYSDIDAEFFYTQEKEREEMNRIVKEYKTSLRERNIPIQFHPAKTFKEVKKEHLTGWNNDDALREYSTALIVLDPQSRFRKLQAQVKFYPWNVLKEKINWLFAEAVFHYHDRYLVALMRGNDLFAEAVKLRIMKLLGNAMLMAAQKFPAFDKHLYAEIRELGDRKLLTTIDQIMTKPVRGSSELVERLLKIVESKLIKEGWIKKQDKE